MLDTIRRPVLPPKNDPSARKFVLGAKIRPLKNWAVRGAALMMLVLLLAVGSKTFALIGREEGGASSHAGHNSKQTFSVDNGLVTHLPFDGNLTDVTNSPNGNGTLVNFGSLPTDGYVAGQYGQALRFDGSNDAVTIGPESSITGVFSIFSWINLTAYPSSGYAVIAASEFSNNSGNNRFNLFIDSAGKLNNYTNTFVTSPSAIPLNTWTQVGVTLGSNGLTLFINGQPVANNGSVSLPSAGTDHVAIGGDGGAETIAGALDDLNIYNRGLTNAEATMLYTGSQAAVCDQACVGYWKLDEDTSTTAADSSGKGNTATLYNFTFDGSTNGWKNGIFGSSLFFNGSNDYVFAPYASSEDTGNHFTVSAWVNPTSRPEGTGVISTAYTNQRVEYELGFGMDEGAGGSSTLKVGFFDGGAWRTAVDPSGDIPLNAWVYIAGTWDGTTMTLYKNGVKIISTIPGGSTATSAQGLLIGRRHDNAGSVNYFPGYIDDARVYNRSLTDYEIYEQYAAGKS